MKKIFTFFALLVAAVLPAVAFNKPASAALGENVKLSPEARQAMSMRAAQTLARLQNGEQIEAMGTRSWQDASGTKWVAMFQNPNIPLTDLLLDENGKPAYAFEEMPFWNVDFTLINYDATGNMRSYLSLPLFWPSYYFWGVTEAEAFVDGDKNKPNYDIVSFYDMCNSPGHINKFSCDGNIFNITDETWCILPTEQFGSAQVVNGVECYINQERDSRIILESYKPDESSTVTFNNQLYFKRADNGNNAGTIRNTYNGPANVQGWDPISFSFKLNSVHVFNAGEVSSQKYLDTEGSNPFFVEFEPLNMYYVFGVDEKYDLMLQDAEGEPIDLETFKQKILLTMAPGETTLTDPNDNYFRGTFFGKVAAADANPVGIFKLGDITEFAVPGISTPFYTITPADGVIVPGQVLLSPGSGVGATWSNDYGMLTKFNSYQTVSSTMTIGIGTTDGVFMYATDAYESKYYGNTDKKIIYHYDQTDITKTREYDSVGDLDSSVNEIAAAGAAVYAANGVITIVPEKNVNVAVYNVAGQVVKSFGAVAGQTAEVAVDGGIYIVKVGSKAVKVAL